MVRKTFELKWKRKLTYIHTPLSLHHPNGEEFLYSHFSSLCIQLSPSSFWDPINMPSIKEKNQFVITEYNAYLQINKISLMLNLSQIYHITITILGCFNTPSKILKNDTSIRERERERERESILFLPTFPSVSLATRWVSFLVSCKLVTIPFIFSWLGVWLAWLRVSWENINPLVFPQYRMLGFYRNQFCSIY